jgi:hypothetical protein
MVQRTADAILIQDNESDLRQVLADLGVPADELERARLDRLRAQLEALRDHPANRSAPQVSTVIGNVHFPLRQTIYAAFLATVKAMGAILALSTNPVAGGITTAIVILDTAEKAQQLISLLDEGELQVLKALSATIAARQPDDPLAGSASLAEIEAFLAARGEHAPDLAGTLTFMVEEKRGVRRFDLRGEVRYAVIP